MPGLGLDDCPSGQVEQLVRASLCPRPAEHVVQLELRDEVLTLPREHDVQELAPRLDFFPAGHAWLRVARAG